MQNMTDDEARYVNETYAPTSRMTPEMWLQAAKAFGKYEEWLAANPAPAEPD
jgi:hypothetical protein